ALGPSLGRAAQLSRGLLGRARAAHLSGRLLDRARTAQLSGRPIGRVRAALRLQPMHLGGAALGGVTAGRAEAPRGLHAAVAVRTVRADEVAALRAVLDLLRHHRRAGAADLAPLLGQVDDARDLLQRGDAAQGLVQAVLADRAHAALDGEVAHLALGHAA